MWLDRPTGARGSASGGGARCQATSQVVVSLFHSVGLRLGRRVRALPAAPGRPGEAD